MTPAPAGVGRFFFGDRWRFAIECDVAQIKGGEPLGAVWLWIGALLAGNPAAEEQIALAAAFLADAMETEGRRPDDFFGHSTTAERKLAIVYWARFGDEDEPEFQQWRSWYGKLAHYQLFHPTPAFDGFAGIVVESGEQETLIWRRSGCTEIHSITLQKGPFKNVVNAFLSWLERVRGRSL